MPLAIAKINVIGRAIAGAWRTARGGLGRGERGWERVGYLGQGEHNVSDFFNTVVLPEGAACGIGPFAAATEAVECCR